MSFWIGDDNDRRDPVRGLPPLDSGKVIPPTQRLMMRASLAEQSTRLNRRFAVSRTWYFLLGFSLGASLVGWLYYWFTS